MLRKISRERASSAVSALDSAERWAVDISEQWPERGSSASLRTSRRRLKRTSRPDKHELERWRKMVDGCRYDAIGRTNPHRSTCRAGGQTRLLRARRILPCG